MQKKVIYLDPQLPAYFYYIYSPHRSNPIFSRRLPSDRKNNSNDGIAGPLFSILLNGNPFSYPNPHRSNCYY